MKIKCAVFAMAFVLSPLASAVTVVTGAKVLNVGSFGNGWTFINIDKTIPETGCTGMRLDIPNNSPEAANWVAMAMTAMSTNKTVGFRTAGCVVDDGGASRPMMSGDAFNSYFFISN